MNNSDKERLPISMYLKKVGETVKNRFLRRSLLSNKSINPRDSWSTEQIAVARIFENFPAKMPEVKVSKGSAEVLYVNDINRTLAVLLAVAERAKRGELMEEEEILRRTVEIPGKDRAEELPLLIDFKNIDEVWGLRRDSLALINGLSTEQLTLPYASKLIGDMVITSWLRRKGERK